MKHLAPKQFDHNQQDKIGVLLINLGTPEKPDAKHVRPYLKEFLSDTRVVEIPKVIWWFILNLIILPFRSKRSAHAYQSIWQKDGSPLFVYSKRLVDKIADKFDSNKVVVKLAMRYGQPSVDSQITELQALGATKLLVLPMYPQYSATTSASTFDAVARSLMNKRRIPELRFINNYHDNELYINALANSVKAHWQQHGKADKLLLSFHGIPKRNWDLGDPYACECYKTSRLLAEKLELAKEDVITTFQSRFGKAEWIKPYTDATLKSLPSKGVESIQVMCPGFSVDCLETLEEIAIENKAYFISAGGTSFQYIDCLNDTDEHVDVLEHLINRHCSQWSTPIDNDRRSEIKQEVENLRAEI